MNSGKYKNSIRIGGTVEGLLKKVEDKHVDRLYQEQNCAFD